MRRRIAIFANGWGDECLAEVGVGVQEYAKVHDMDIFAFVNYSIPPLAGTAMNVIENYGEYNLFQLPDIKAFDGVILLTNSFNMQEEIDYLTQAVRESGVPAVSILYDIEGMHFIDGDNYSGMYELMNHLILEKGDRELLYIGGTKGHPECKIRMQAFIDAAKENGIVLEDKNIQFGDWAANSAINLVQQWISDNGSLPDAIVCANDIMAIGLCEWLKDNGYKVPEQVNVTGFDCLSQGQSQWPTLTTVNRNWKTMGYQAAEFLFERDIKEPVRIKLPSKLVKGGSSGCDIDRRRPEFWEGLGRKPVRKQKKDALAIDQHFRKLYMSVRKDESTEDLNRSLNWFLNQDNWVEGERFMLCLHPDFFCLDETDSEFKKSGYPDTIDMVCCIRDREAEAARRIQRGEAVFLLAEGNQSPGIYVFAPIHSEDRNYGFAVMSRDFSIVEENLLYIWTRHVNQYLEQVRSNAKIAELTKKLTELSYTDILTNTYNRAACEKFLYPSITECQSAGGRGVLMLADVDHMKHINDKYGHAAGDLALCTVAELLKEELPMGFMVARFGGDEFLVTGMWDGKFELDSLIHRVEERLVDRIKARNIKFPLTVSIGGIMLEAGERFILIEALQKADENMYREKEVHHRNPGSFGIIGKRS